MVQFFLRFITNLVHLTISLANSGFDVFKNTWSRNAEEKYFLNLGGVYFVYKRTTCHWR